jgi:drug/metabolite transporter (DMT)-like permease
MKTNSSSIILILIAAVATAFAQIVLKVGSRLKIAGLKLEVTQNGLGAVRNIFNPSSEVFHFLVIGFGFFLFMLTLLILARGFKGGDMSLLYPIFATSFIWNIIFSRVFLGEHITFFKVIGVLIIVSGIALTGFGQKQSTIEEGKEKLT